MRSGNSTAACYVFHTSQSHVRPLTVALVLGCRPGERDPEVARGDSVYALRLVSRYAMAGSEGRGV